LGAKTFNGAILNTSRKIKLLKDLKSGADEIKNRSSSDPVFKTWKNTVERTLSKIFGPESQEIKQFEQLDFFFHAMIMSLDADYSSDHRRCFDRDMEIALRSIEQYISEFEEELGEELGNDKVEKQSSVFLERVFVSHSSKDLKIVEELVELLELIGLESNQIFCTSLPGYDIDLGDNFIDALKDELGNNVLVIFFLSRNFYQSPVCLCEMGATWALSKDHVPIVVPPLTFNEVNGVFPLTQGLVITDALRINALKDKIIKEFNISDQGKVSTWERRRDRILDRIQNIIDTQQGH
jgi:hypothetical protein